VELQIKVSDTEAAEKSPVVLIIEDEAAIRMSYVNFLEDLDFEVHQAADGITGVEAFGNINPDIVLLDLRMPGMGGLEVLETIVRADSEIPVIIISGTGGISDVVQALRLGAADYLIKPIEDMMVLEHSINRSLQSCRMKREKEAYRQSLEAALIRIGQDENAARKLQLKLMPPTPDGRDGLEFRWHYFPSSSLSGDFIEYFEVMPDIWAFCFADVSGHGTSSALVTVYLKASLRGYLERLRFSGVRTVLEPAELMTAMNRELIEMSLGKHVAMVYGILDRKKASLVWSHAGHYPYPVLNQSNRQTELGGDCPPLGLFEGTVYSDGTVSLEESFLITFFSDGALEVLAGLATREKVEFLNSLDSVRKVDGFARQVGKFVSIPDDFTVLTIEAGHFDMKNHVMQGDDLQEVQDDPKKH
jgi:serine phosphatase RsbU (regulator of sigma subunit)